MFYLMQVLLLGLVSYMLYTRRKKPAPKVYTEDEKQQIIDNFHPEPLEGTEPLPRDHYAINPKYVQGCIRCKETLANLCPSVKSGIISLSTTRNCSIAPHSTFSALWATRG